MSTDLGTLRTPHGDVPVTHRLALAVWPLDALHQHPVTHGLRVGVERPGARPRRSRPLQASGGGVFLLPHGSGVPTTPGARLPVRVTDPRGRYAPRRLDVPLWVLPEVRAAEEVPPTGDYIPALRRTVRPWLLPGPAYFLPRGVSGLRLRVLRQGRPVRWARAEAFDAAGHRVAWGHGDEHGQVTLVVDDLAPGTPATTKLAVRVHVPDPTSTTEPTAEDPWADLPVETVPRPAAPPTFDDDVTLGVAVPPTYLTSTQDGVLDLRVGVLSPQHDLEFH
ncbi:hypothetical protein PU560_13875 [Georgenia sp. 10Sc9-8]|uniref:Uncharacterized protein n=1 Tax=Georgenia halotolerans TaxID=3028317 RepID=A0ABT5TZP5_9MICO|nr:hypothetical protein [Georgenia halotolerans]